MEITRLAANVQSLEAEIEWLTKVLDTRFKLYFNNPCDYTDVTELAPPSCADASSIYAEFVYRNNLSAEERIALILTLVPHVKPELLDVFFTRNISYDKNFSEFGGMKGKNFNGFIPTGETLLFIIAGSDMHARMEYMDFFLSHCVLFSGNVLKLAPADSFEPRMCGPLEINTEYLSFFTNGIFSKPDYSPNFPAKLISTLLEWDDLVLDEHVMNEVNEIKVWIKWNSRVAADDPSKRLLKPGYRTLFYGPPGTGKTLTVSLLGKITGKDVYKIDLSMLVSKYIGETEKNLASVFDMAENKNWILFFDEADALFGKRTVTATANDRYSNQEIAYLLQRIEDFPGLIILATNLKTNIDDAFARRFQSMVHFPIPAPKQRLILWQSAFRNVKKIDADCDFKKLAEKYVLTGGAIINILMHCLLYEESSGLPVSYNVVLAGIKKELYKEGKTI